MNQAVVMTSIFHPGESVRRFADLPDWQLVVVADRKTPPGWQQAGTRFIYADEQRRLPFKIIGVLTWNHYARKMIGYLYLPPHVNFRVTDILRSHVAQPIMWAAGYRLGFTRATVDQVRNAHDFMDDFRSELPLFLDAEAMTAAIGDALRAGDTIADNLHRVYAHLSAGDSRGPMKCRLSMPGWRM